MAEERRLVIPGVLERVPEVCEFVSDAAEAVGLDERGVYHCQMAADEWCTNVVEHGYEGNQTHSHIEVLLQLQTGELKIIFKDDGPPFDPTQLPEPDPTLSLEDRQPGGLGWFFIRKIMDEVQYEFKGGRNHLTMIKKGTPQAAAQARSEPESPFPVHTTTSGARVMTPEGRIDSLIGRQFEAALLAQIEAGNLRLVVDMHKISYMSSTGLKTLLTALRRLQEHGGGIALAAMTDRVHEVFDISGFDTLFTIVPTVEEAERIVLRAAG